MDVQKTPQEKPGDEPHPLPSPDLRGGTLEGRVVFLFVAGLALSLLLLLPILFRVRLDSFGEFINRYAPNPQWAGLPFPAVLAGLMVILVCAALARASEWKEGERGGRIVAGILALLAALKFLLHLCVILFLGEFSLAEAVWPFVNPLGDGAYNLEASSINDLDLFMNDYEKAFLESPRLPLIPHVETHPPGPLLLFYGLQRGLEAFPAFRTGLEKAGGQVSPILQEMFGQASSEWKNYRYPLATSLAAALLCFVLASSVPVWSYLLAREFAGRPAAFAVAGISAFFPGSYCYSPGLDQILAVPSLLICLLGFRAARSRTFGYGLLLGLACLGSLFMTLGLLVALGMLFWSAAAACAGAETAGDFGEPILRRCVRRLKEQTRPALGFAAGFFIPAMALMVGWRFNLFSVLAACQKNNASYLREYGVNYWPWVARNLVEASYSMGMPAALGLLAMVCLRLRGAWQERSLKGESPFFWGVSFTFFLLWALGINRAEVARIWLFLFPVAYAAAAGALDGFLSYVLTPGKGRVVLQACCVAALTLQAATVLVIRAGVDALETGKFFYSVLRKIL